MHECTVLLILGNMHRQKEHCHTSLEFVFSSACCNVHLCVLFYRWRKIDALTESIIMNNSSETHNSTQDSPPDCPYLQSSALEWVKNIVYLVILFLALFGNALVMRIVYKHRRMQTATNYLIVNMAVSFDAQFHPGQHSSFIHYAFDIAVAGRIAVCRTRVKYEPTIADKTS